MLKLREHLAARRGFSLVEVVIAMAMVAVIAGAITFTILAKIAEAKIQRGVDEVSTLEKGVASWVYRTGNTAYTSLSLSDMVTVGAVPTALNGSTANPWGGKYAVNGTGGNSFDIAVYNAPNNVLSAFQGAFGTRATVSFTNNLQGSGSSGLLLQFSE